MLNKRAMIILSNTGEGAGSPLDEQLASVVIWMINVEINPLLYKKGGWSKFTDGHRWQLDAENRKTS